MHQAFIRTLVEIAEADSRVVLLTGDLGYTVVEPYSEVLPERFFNVGVAEQNMVGLATGLAESGYIPFVYSIATFASMRAFEFIRNGPVLHGLPVRIVGVGGGFDYGAAGPTHHALEDVALMRTQPGLSIFVPADSDQARRVLLATWSQPGPIYYRLGKDDRNRVPGLDGRFDLARVQRIREGRDLVFLAMGSVATEVVAAAVDLEHRHVDCAVHVVASLSPPPTQDLIDILGRTRVAITVEAHYTTGGLGSLVSEIVAEQGLQCRVIRRGVGDHVSHINGDAEFLLAQH
ncbi:MAG: 1-deoxy-D-xylulose-5-phosphate synthase, partial [Chloroflexi bacterium]|nr:1-deoxy-D-xylulose-5-phosphate synthase [Chloroflexota bacterium]